MYHAFYWAGFAVRPNVTYEELMTATDEAGVHRSYLASEDSFSFLKKLESQNLVVPVVGDFGGPKAIRAVGAYLKAHNAFVSTFYLSNVEQYLVAGRQVVALLQERRDASARRREHVHPDDQPRLSTASAEARGSSRAWARWPKK